MHTVSLLFWSPLNFTFCLWISFSWNEIVLLFVLYFIDATVVFLKARRAFRTLKGIIRLQALIRGHLVRRQAIATLHCLHAIVKFQALVRGQKVRCSTVGIEVQKACNIGKVQVIYDELGDLLFALGYCDCYGHILIIACSCWRLLVCFSENGVYLQLIILPYRSLGYE